MDVSVFFMGRHALGWWGASGCMWDHEVVGGGRRLGASVPCRQLMSSQAQRRHSKAAHRRHQRGLARDSPVILHQYLPVAGVDRPVGRRVKLRASKASTLEDKSPGRGFHMFAIAPM